MSNAPTSDDNGNSSSVTAEQWRELNSMTDEEINAAALSDPDNPPLTREQLAQFRRPALVKRLRLELKMDRETFASVYGIPLETRHAWERHEAEPTPVEMAYLRLIEREPERAKQGEVA